MSRHVVPLIVLSNRSPANPDHTKGSKSNERACFKHAFKQRAFITKGRIIGPTLHQAWDASLAKQVAVEPSLGSASSCSASSWTSSATRTRRRKQDSKRSSLRTTEQCRLHGAFTWRAHRAANRRRAFERKAALRRWSSGSSCTRHPRATKPTLSAPSSVRIPRHRETSHGHKRCRSQHERC